MSLLRIEHLSLRAGDTEVVRDLSLTLAAGEKMALVGESGSGKTVTAHAILQLNQGLTQQGSICFNGQELLGASTRQLASIRGREIAMVFQEPMSALNPLYTIGQQIAEVLQRHQGLSARAARTRAIELLEWTHIREPALKVDRYPFQLSGGQRQRAMIAMALACRPRLLIADEPTTALDVTVQAQIMALLTCLQQEVGMAVLLITHNLNLVRCFAERVAVMQAGVLVEQGSVSTLFQQPQHPYTQRLLASALPPLPIPATTSDAVPIIDAQQLNVRFSQRVGWFQTRITQAVENVSLQLAPGRTLGIVGESGSGKTSLGLALLKLLPLEAQRLQLAGQDWLHLGRRALSRARRDAQVVLQDPYAALSPRMTVEQSVNEGLALHHPHLSATARRARVLALFDDVGLHPEMLSRYPHAFSGGQRQRIAIARALIVQPKILLLDEPTSALDVTIQRQVIDLLLHLQEKYGLSYVFISHDLAVIRAVAHDVVVLQDGRVVEAGPAAAVLRSPQHPYTQRLMSSVVDG